jgi:hypothetical protein
LNDVAVVLFVAKLIPFYTQLYREGVQVGPTLVSPVTGDNGYWVASSSYGENHLLPSSVIDSMKICSYDSGAVVFIDFQIYNE